MSKSFTLSRGINFIDAPKDIEALYLDETVNSFSYIFFEKLKQIIVHPDNEYFSSEDGVLYNKDKSTLFLYPSQKKDVYFKIPSTVKVLRSCSFSHNKYIKRLDFNKQLTSIDFNTFEGVELDTVFIPNLKKYCEIEFIGQCSFPFSDNTKLQIEEPGIDVDSIEFKDISKVPSYAFCNARGINNLYFYSDIEIGEAAFYYCDLQSVITGTDITLRAGNGSFGENENLKFISYAKDLCIIGSTFNKIKTFGAIPKSLHTESNYLHLKADEILIMSKAGLSVEKFVLPEITIDILLDIYK
jgi:hypothetical protein